MWVFSVIIVWMIFPTSHRVRIDLKLFYCSVLGVTPANLDLVSSVLSSRGATGVDQKTQLRPFSTRRQVLAKGIASLDYAINFKSPTKGECQIGLCLCLKKVCCIREVKNETSATATTRKVKLGKRKKIVAWKFQRRYSCCIAIRISVVLSITTIIQ